MSILKAFSVTSLWGKKDLTLNLHEDINFLIGTNGSGNPPTVCRHCGKPIRRGTESCSACSKVNSRDALLKAAQKGRIAAQQPEVLARLGKKQRSHRLAELAWKPEDKPAWLDEVAYSKQIHPKLANISLSTIAMTLGVSLPYASDIRAGRNRPHQRHWLALARLAKIVSSTQ